MVRAQRAIDPTEFADLLRTKEIMKNLPEEVRICSEHGEGVTIKETDFLPNPSAAAPFAKAAYVGCCDAAINKVISGIIAFAVTQEVLLQASYIATTAKRELKSLSFDPFRHHFILEFTLAKLAVLSIKSESLADRSLANALLREIEAIVSHRCGLEPNARDAFRHYQELARKLNEAVDVPGKDFALFFMQRYQDITASLQEANGRRLTEADLAVSSSVVGDYCWPLKNQTEARVFGTK